ncbi:hypothetical protein ACTHS7_12485, partial [Neisseria sp. P0015.S009]|uniref:hypothetical protein n=1 Tax=Neisseria sp. P0015.S009 TaxID=3436765 RepID=UPI003F7F1CFC
LCFFVIFGFFFDGFSAALSLKSRACGFWGIRGRNCLFFVNFGFGGCYNILCNEGLKNLNLVMHQSVQYGGYG